MAEGKQGHVEEDGKVVAQASVSPADENGEAQVQVHVASGHLPAGTRQKVAEAVHEALNEDQTRRVTAAVPIGDAELVEGIRSRLDDAELRAAGATSIIQGEVRSDRPTGRPDRLRSRRSCRTM